MVIIKRKNCPRFNTVHFLMLVINKYILDVVVVVVSLLNSADEDSVPVHQERLIRTMLREFPYPESQLLQQMVRTLTTPEIVCV